MAHLQEKISSADCSSAFHRLALHVTHSMRDPHSIDVDDDVMVGYEISAFSSKVNCHMKALYTVCEQMKSHFKY